MKERTNKFIGIGNYFLTLLYLNYRKCFVELLHEWNKSISRNDITLTSKHVFMIMDALYGCTKLITSIKFCKEFCC
jgi:hypothetical protein